MEFINKRIIKLDKEINELDKFVFRFVNILRKHINYVIVSGYVAILLGRDRATEDVDVIIPKINKEELNLLYKDLIADGFWCLNSSDLNEMHDMLISKHSIRFAIEPQVSPNVEIKFSKDVYDDIALKNSIKIKFGNFEVSTSFLELQIAYKEEVLKSNKDMEDARHLRLIANGHLNKNIINEYKKKLRSER